MRPSVKVVIGQLLIDISGPGVGCVQPECGADGPYFREIHCHLQSGPLYVSSVVLLLRLYECPVRDFQFHRGPIVLFRALDEDLSCLAVHLDGGFGRHSVTVWLPEYVVGERRIDTEVVVASSGDVIESGKGDFHPAEGSIQTDLRIVVLLPLQIGIGGEFIWLGIIYIGDRITVRKSEGEYVPVFLFGVEHIVGRQLFGHAPSAAQGNIFTEVPFEVETRGECGLVLIDGVAYEHVLKPEPRHQFQTGFSHRHGQELFRIDCKIVHKGIVGVGPRPVAGRSK